MNWTASTDRAKEAIAFLILMILAARLISLLTPPFQSQDEFNHVKRAYLLSRGAVFITERTIDTGAGIDEGLLAYMNCFKDLPFNYSQKGGNSTALYCEEIHFTGTERFSELPNTALYFPLAYTPQAIAFIVGRWTNLSVSNTYYLARILVLTATSLILLWAFLLYPPPLASFVILSMPMSLFQFSAASLDSVSFALAALVAALFLAAMDTRHPFAVKSHAALAVSIFILITARLIFIPLIALPIAIYWRRRSWYYLVSASIVTAFAGAWIIFVLRTVHGSALGYQRMPPISEAVYYLSHPIELLSVFWRTFTDPNMIRSYWVSFVGLLGWLDTPLDPWVYFAMTALTIFALLICFGAGQRSLDAGSVAPLAAAAIISLVFLFLFALVSWNSTGTRVIDGVQGRYFYPTAILLAYAFPWQASGPRRRICLWIIALTAGAAMNDVTQKLLSRFW